MIYLVFEIGVWFFRTKMRKYLSKIGWSKASELDDVAIEEAVTKLTDQMDEAKKEEIIRSNFLPKVHKLASKLPFVRDMLAGYHCMIDGQTPKVIKGAILIPLVYFVVPIDAVPDFIPVAGYTDDITVWLAAVKVFGSYINELHYSKADEVLHSDSRDNEISPNTELPKL